MEEKERYINLSDRQVKDTQNNSQGFMSINSICNILNQQDKELSKLRASCQQVKEENQQLKQQLHDLPKKIVGEVEKNFTEYLPLKYKTGAGFYLRLNTILKMYGGEDE